ncbi:hypothetical protein [Afipia carboxidovorans]|uniref:hypothetical protein n=1 Tax=Afipia carboxidovorans TaxID=40137 RepID=UPI0030919D17|nr:hypothetical protein CRBSH125_26400 [Afipia carboxidovorans]
MAMHRSDRNIIKGLDHRNVEATLVGLKTFMSDSHWVSLSNPYATDIQKLRRDIKSGNAPHQKELAQYIVASCLLHCSDGWSYLGRSISALLRGDPHIARHLAYYAELRATKSLLASQGLGVFNHHHFAVTGVNSAVQLSDSTGTHDFAWASLDYWSSLAGSGALFTELVRPFGINLSQWFASVGGSAKVANQAQSWFRQWGMDLKSFPADRDARNASSYQPDGLPEPWQIKASDALAFVTELWRSLEPSANSRFDIIDNHIFRAAVEAYFKGVNGKSRIQKPAEFDRFIRSVVVPQNLGPVAEKEIIRFLKWQELPTESLILSRSRELSKSNDNGAEAVMSRATLLLRTASGAASNLFRAVGITEAQVAFWSNNLGRSRGLWESAAPATLSDLWADISLQLDEVESFQTKYTKSKQTFYRVGAELHEALVDLGSCERAAIWGASP